MHEVGDFIVPNSFNYTRTAELSLSRGILAQETIAHYKFEVDSLSVQWGIVFQSALRFSIFNIYLYILL